MLKFTSNRLSFENNTPLRNALIRFLESPGVRESIIREDWEHVARLVHSESRGALLNFTLPDRVSFFWEVIAKAIPQVLFQMHQIPDWFLLDNEDLIEVDIPANIEVVGEEAFRFCSNLKKISLTPGKLWAIEGFAFQNTSKELEVIFNGPASKFFKIELGNYCFRQDTKVKCNDRTLHLSF